MVEDKGPVLFFFSKEDLWMANRYVKDVKHHWESEKCNLIPQWVITSVRITTIKKDKRQQKLTEDEETGTLPHRQ